MSFSTGLLLGKSIATIDLPGEVTLKVKHWEWSRSCLVFFLQLQLGKHLQPSLTTLKYFPCLNGILGLKPIGLRAPNNTGILSQKTQEREMNTALQELPYLWCFAARCSLFSSVWVEESQELHERDSPLALKEI